VQWKRLAILVVIVLSILVVSVTWARIRGSHTHRTLPAFIPGTPGVGDRL
jgi:hypothetical protein